MSVMREGIKINDDGSINVTFASGSTIDSPTFAGTPAGVGVPVRLAAWSWPFISAPTGTMANNGAVTLGTALGATYGNGCYLYLPANAIQAGSAAGWYWTVMSSSTVGQVFDSTYTSGNPSAGTATAFTSTGPGAFTGVTTEQGITITLPIMLPGAQYEVYLRQVGNNSAGAKTVRARLGGSSGTDMLSPGSSLTTQVEAHLKLFVGCDGAATQNAYYESLFAGSQLSIPVTKTTAAINTAVSTTAFISVQKAVATDVAAIEFGRMYLYA